MRQPAIVDVKIRVKNCLALSARESRLGLDPFARLLLLRIGQKARFEIAHDIGILFGDVCRFSGVAGEVEQFRLAGQQGYGSLR